MTEIYDLALDGGQDYNNSAEHFIVSLQLTAFYFPRNFLQPDNLKNIITNQLSTS